jgi:hypothetical protein
MGGGSRVGAPFDFAFELGESTTTNPSGFVKSGVNSIFS